MLQTAKYEFEFWAEKDGKVKTFTKISGSRIVAFEELKKQHPSWNIRYEQSQDNPFQSEEKLAV
jgi:hypothetical protein